MRFCVKHKNKILHTHKHTAHVRATKAPRAPRLCCCHPLSTVLAPGLFSVMPHHTLEIFLAHSSLSLTEPWIPLTTAWRLESPATLQPWGFLLSLEMMCLKYAITSNFFCRQEFPLKMHMHAHTQAHTHQWAVLAATGKY